ncbi:MAG: hypothetical protein AAGK37_07385 [Pseudomonadota bacterium]
MNPFVFLVGLLGFGGVGAMGGGTSGGGDDDDGIQTDGSRLSPGRAGGAKVAAASAEAVDEAGAPASSSPAAGEPSGPTGPVPASGSDPAPNPPAASAGGGGSAGPTALPPVSDPEPDPPATSGGGAAWDPVTPPPASVADPTPDAPAQSGTSGDGEPTVVSAPINGSLEVMAGRVATIAPDADDIADLRILSAPSHGTLTVNPDNSLALVLTKSNYVGDDSLEYEITHTDGSTSQYSLSLDVVEGAQEAGWATGENNYMLEVGDDGRIVVEHGDNHTKVYATGSDDAYSLARIASIEGLDVEDITAEWLADNGTYGHSEGMALDDEAAELLWRHVTPRFSETSNWLLLEKGYSYDFERIVDHGTFGESPLNPIYVGAWGEGERPILENPPYAGAGKVGNLVYQGIHFDDVVKTTGMTNVLVDDALFTSRGLSANGGAQGITVRDSAFYEIHREEPVDENGDGIWDPKGSVGLFADNMEGLLLEGNFFDHIGWEDDFLPDGSIEGGQPPVWFSHNIYIQNEAQDVTVRDTISMRSAADGMLLRSSGYVEDMVFIDNNVASYAHGGDYAGAGPVGHYLYMTDTVATEAGYLFGLLTGSVGKGLVDTGLMSTFNDNIVAHSFDPNDPEAFLETTRTDPGLEIENEAYYDDTIVWNWFGQTRQERTVEQNVEGLDPDALNETTIHNFIEALLGDGNDIDEFAEYLRAEAEGTTDDIVDADLIIDYFQQGFGVDDGSVRDDAETLRFIPNDIGDGVRWDNRANWSTDDLPGTVEGDSVDLGGNHVIFNGNAAIERLDMHTAELEVHGGKLSADDGIAGGGDARLEISGAGQVWMDGTGGGLEVEMTDGRLVNEGLARHVDLNVKGGQAILATGGAAWEIDQGHYLSIAGGDAKVGFDGDDGGIAILDVGEGGTLSFSADENGLGTIEEFRSGAMGDAPNVLSGIDLEDATLDINLSGLGGAAGNSFVLMDADEITGMLDTSALSIESLGARNAMIYVDYDADAVRLELTSGSGQIGVETIGDVTDRDASEDELWAALTQGHGLQDDLPENEDEDLLDVA